MVQGAKAIRTSMQFGLRHSGSVFGSPVCDASSASISPASAPVFPV
jgi:hypothetical protein